MDRGLPLFLPNRKRRTQNAERRTQNGGPMHVSPDHLLVAGCVGPQPRPTIDQKVLAILVKRFPGATADQIAAAANALMALTSEPAK